MKKVFSSGSCRLLTTINDGYNKIEPIHSMFNNFVGVNFLGKLHNIKQHIQFIKFIRNEIELPEYILKNFLTTFIPINELKYRFHIDNLPSDIPNKLENIRKEFDKCDVYMFEICSLKIYEKDGLQVQYELTNDFILSVQTKDELISDLETLIGMLPGKQIIFQSHFRLNKIFNDENLKVENREIIYKALEIMVKKYSNVLIYDPSDLLNKDKSLFDNNTHFHACGYKPNFECLFNKINIE